MPKLRILYCIDSVGYSAGTEKQLVEIIRRRGDMPDYLARMAVG